MEATATCRKFLRAAKSASVIAIAYKFITPEYGFVMPENRGAEAFAEYERAVEIFLHNQIMPIVKRIAVNGNSYTANGALEIPVNGSIASVGIELHCYNRDNTDQYRQFVDDLLKLSRQCETKIFCADNAAEEGPVKYILYAYRLSDSG